MAIPDPGLAAWLILQGVPGIGAASLRRLLAEIGLPEAVLAAPRARLAAIVGEDRAVAILRAAAQADGDPAIARALDWAAQDGNAIVTLADAAYPASLFAVADPPPLLYAKGRLELLGAPAIAIVGSRNASAQGLANAEAFARALSAAGLTIVSGQALGIDAAAHRGGLAGGASTIAVIGTGADIVYPSRNRELAHAIAADGLILSEFPLGTPALAPNFPRRNRIISGLARGVLVVEAALRSGSLITARQAAEQGREVFAVPGSIHSPVSKGCHALIKQGAKLVESAADILEEFGAAAPAAGAAATAAPAPAPSEPAQAVLQAMGFEAVAFDVLAGRAGLATDRLAALLLELELAGRIAPLPGGRYQRLGS
ncbi:MAG: DNA-protecting protein DprA [Burkholderiales bacterium]|nr:DNA-protecting protein DprA [Burkholderiales bacterium]